MKMCPFSGMVQFLIVIVTLLLLCHFTIAKTLQIKFQPPNITLHMYDSAELNYTIYENPNGTEVSNLLEIYTENKHVVEVEKQIYITNETFPLSGSINLTGIFLGQSKVRCRAPRTNAILDNSLDVIVVRKKRVIDQVFTASVATLVSIIYINFGCILNWGELLKKMKRPIGPVIGLVAQFLLMPVLSYGIGLLLFPNSPEMQLGMFFTGVSPAGGASNIWTLILEGNVDLSITMTTISTFAAFGMMPLWIFTLGKTIFEKGNIEIPYAHIASLAGGLVIPLGIGYLLTRYRKKEAQFLARILKGVSSLLILFIIIFAIITNLYLFELFSWQIIVAGMGLPYLGFLLAYLLAKALRQPEPDCLAISIEAGIQNTGIAIFLLRFALPEPQGDLTTVVPVAVAIMTPIPLAIMYFYKKISSRLSAAGDNVNRRKISSTSTVDANFNFRPASEKTNLKLTAE